MDISVSTDHTFQSHEAHQIHQHWTRSKRIRHIDLLSISWLGKVTGWISQMVMANRTVAKKVTYSPTKIYSIEKYKLNTDVHVCFAIISLKVQFGSTYHFTFYQIFPSIGSVYVMPLTTCICPHLFLQVAKDSSYRPLTEPYASRPLRPSSNQLKTAWTSR